MTLKSNKRFTLFCVIVDCHKAERVFYESKKIGATGGTFFFGKGTVSSSLLSILGFNEIKKEILIMVIDEEMEEKFHVRLTKKFQFDKPNHGIAFSMPIRKILGLGESEYISNSQKRGVEVMGHEAILTIVDKGLSGDVIEAAKSAGSRGGTVVHGRGSGTKENVKLFNVEIEPEKEIVLILSEVDETDDIVNKINEALKIDKPGRGIVFVLDVNRTSGLVRGN